MCGETTSKGEESEVVAIRERRKRREKRRGRDVWKKHGNMD